MGWLALSAYLVLLVGLLPVGKEALLARVLLLHGVGLFWSGWLLWREGLLGSLRPLTARPAAGVVEGLLIALLGGMATRLPGAERLAQSLQPWVFPTPGRGEQSGAFPRRLLAAGAGMAEEGIFRGMWQLRWGGFPSLKTRWVLALCAISGYFALLHWPQGAAEVLQAFAGSMLLGLLLSQRPNLWSPATLHGLWNLLF